MPFWRGGVGGEWELPGAGWGERRSLTHTAEGGRVGAGVGREAKFDQQGGREANFGVGRDAHSGKRYGQLQWRGFTDHA